MDGPAHYREAERLLNVLYGKEHGTDPDEASIAAEAQVHATLALAAATALGQSPADAQAWAATAGVRLDEGT